MISCSQKYDETGIFDPQDPNLFADTLVTIAEKDTIVNNLSMIQDEYLYLGTDIVGGDTTAYGEILFNFELFNTDSTLDSAYILMPILTDSIFDTNSTKPFDVFRVTNAWDAEDVTRDQLILTDQTTLNFVDYPDTTITDQCIKISLDPNALMSWFTEDSINTNFNGFLIRSTIGNEITPIIKLFSSRRPYESNWPKVHRFTTDSVLAYDGVTDSTFVVETINNLTTDLSFVKKESACLDTADSKFKIGGISGEGIVCKIELDSIPSNATVITGRFEMDHTGSDPIYGDIRNSSSTTNELCVYKVTNSDWSTDITLLEYDTLNVWTYKIEPLDSTTTLMVADGMMQEWVTDPATNHGFYITSKNWG
ncbi:MAG: hypothetical protein KAS62_00355, partial [Candidatus Delongbacteria bacterium]|nr:hypothetical protein [Candidatus Delongbacteria bacterium]